MMMMMMKSRRKIKQAAILMRSIGRGYDGRRGVVMKGRRRERGEGGREEKR